MGKSHKDNNSTLFIKNKSDEELIDKVHQLQAEVGLESFTVTDLILRDAIITQLEERGYIITEVLKIEHKSKVESDMNNQDKGEDEGKEEEPSS